MIRPLLVALSIVAAATLGLAGCSDDIDGADGADSTGSTEPVQRVQLGQTTPANAPGQQLYLQRVIIAPGAQLAQHFHEGTQVAYVESGTLTYNIVSGSVDVTDSTGATSTATGPTVIELTPGSWLVESDQVTHYGANAGDEPVVILLTALLADGAPMATPTDG
jgi:quercetin dioxygenase-like cupin family protein